MNEETQHEKSLRLLQKYLDETTEEERRKDWEKVKNVGANGPTVEEYFESLGGVCSQEVAELRKENEQEKADAQKWYKKYNDMSAMAFNSANKASDQAETIKRLTKALEEIERTGEDTGRKGCTYGDTDYDSLSVVYGYNICLEQFREIAKSALSGTK